VMKPAEEEGETITEASPVEPTWDYPTSKVEAEKVIRRERGRIPALILRIAGVYDDRCHSIPIAQHIRRIHEKSFESYFFPGDTDHGQPFIHVDDLVECFRNAVRLRGRLGPEETLLIAEADIMTYSELQDALGALIHGKEWPTIRIPAPVAKAGAWIRDKLAGPGESFIKPWMIDLADDHYPVSIGRAHRLLEWEPQRQLRDTLPIMIGHLNRDARAWYKENKLVWPEKEPADRP
jgi:nucleoside-diphosphate-sugar epimerase